MGRSGRDHAEQDETQVAVIEDALPPASAIFPAVRRFTKWGVLVVAASAMTSTATMRPLAVHRAVREAVLAAIPVAVAVTMLMVVMCVVMAHCALVS